jgi:GTP-binding protein
VVLVVSKWDKVKAGEDHEGPRRRWTSWRQEMPHLAYAPGGVHQQPHRLRLDRLMPTIQKVHEEYSRGSPPARSTSFVEDADGGTRRPPRRASTGKIYYITQIDARPPRFLVSVNDPSSSTSAIGATW